MIRIRKANTEDFNELYKIGLSMPELKVSNEVFMSEEDFRLCIRTRQGSFNVAFNENRIVGFAYAEKTATSHAALVFAAVIPEYRKKGIGMMLVQQCMKDMKKLGAKIIYGLATNQNAVNLLKSLGYKEGKELVWMDRKL